jgi:hypothetical protein
MPPSTSLMILSTKDEFFINALKKGVWIAETNIQHNGTS